jgi:hypothetical protein
MRGHARVVEEHEVRRIPGRRGPVPGGPRRRDVRPVVFAGAYGLF